MMLLSKFFVATPFLFAFAVASAEIPRSNWSMTCSNASINGGTLSAECKRMNGSSNPTNINTDQFIGNIDGTLMSSATSGDIPRSNWSMTCKNATLNGGVLSAECKRMDGSYNPTSINTDGFIGNIDGVLMTNL